MDIETLDELITKINDKIEEYEKLSKALNNFSNDETNIYLCDLIQQVQTLLNFEVIPVLRIEKNKIVEAVEVFYKYME